MAQDEASACVLVVRLWQEPLDEPEGAREWRGEVKHVLTGRVVYFRHHEGLVGAIRKLCGGQVNPPPGREIDREASDAVRTYSRWKSG